MRFWRGMQGVGPDHPPRRPRRSEVPQELSSHTPAHVLSHGLTFHADIGPREWGWGTRPQGATPVAATVAEESSHAASPDAAVTLPSTAAPRSRGPPAHKSQGPESRPQLQLYGHWSRKEDAGSAPITSTMTRADRRGPGSLTSRALPAGRARAGRTHAPCAPAPVNLADPQRACEKGDRLRDRI